jgi:hypothetical protein
MLDIQRRREKPRSAPAIIFTRTLIAAHLFLAAVAATLFLTHHLFIHCLVVLGWMLLSWLPVWLMMNRHQVGRIAWGLFLFAGFLGAAFILLWQHPAMDRDAAVMVTRRVLPFWLTIYLPVYGALTLMAFGSSRVWRATEKGFTILETPDSEYGE